MQWPNFLSHQTIFVAAVSFWSDTFLLHTIYVDGQRVHFDDPPT